MLYLRWLRASTKWRRWHIGRALMRVAVSALVATWVGASDSTADEPRPIDFAEYLSSYDLVLDGTVTAVDTVQRARLGGCGMSVPSVTKSWDIHVRVSRVIQGTAEDSSVVLTTLGRSQFPGLGLRPGVRVIAWGFRNCTDGWRLWGNVVIVTSKGQLVPDHNNAAAVRLDGGASSVPVRVTALDSALDAKAQLSSIRSFDGRAAVGLLRVTAIVPGDNGAYAIACDSVSLLVGVSERVPRYVDIMVRPPCTRDIEVGDSLIVAIPSGYSGERLTWHGCTGSLLVKNRFVRGFGVPIEFMSYAVRVQQDGVRVRPFISRE